MKCYFLLGFILYCFDSFAQFFSQDFSFSTSVADYVSLSPNNQQLTSIQATGALAGVAISGGALVLSRNGGNVAYFARTSNFSSVPNLLLIEFDFAIPVSTASVTSGAIFRLGRNYTDDGTIPANADTYARIGVNLTGNANEFQFRDISNGTNSPTFSGTQRITWLLNNTSLSTTYIAPNGSSQSVAPAKFDLWVGNDLVFDEVDRLSNVAVEDIKLMFSAGEGSLSFDNFTIKNWQIPLPLEWLEVRAQSVENEVFIRWKVQKERNNVFFEIEKSADGISFSAIGRLKGSNHFSEIKSYQFIDYKPFTDNYYRIKQVDEDGRYSYSKVLFLKMENEPPLVFPNPTEDCVEVNIPKGSDCRLELYTIYGQKVAESTENKLFVGHLPSSFYHLRIKSRDVWREVKLWVK
jgi:hypothetical protein